jgi:hypothetical protein
MNKHEQADSTVPSNLPQRNLRLALILASVAAVFFFGFVAKAVMLSQH